ncbi:MAG: hypothetical protein WCV68_03260 [Candidatus Paceibacterota bacterium]|jgi:hypothetical protein
MKEKKPFRPYFHFCQEGNHFHLVTGPKGFGASPAFASAKGAKFLIEIAMDPQNRQDVADAERLEQQLPLLRIQRGDRKKGLWAYKCDVESCSIPGWAKLINGSLRTSNMGSFMFFANTPCDFVGKEGTETKFSMFAKKVEQVAKNEVLA